MNQIVTIEHVEKALEPHRSHWSSLLPDSLKPDKFIAASRSAILARPELLSLPTAKVLRELDKAANDGLVPDGREAVINVYKGEPVYIPMTLGIRKRAIELAHIYITAEVVHEHDTFRVRRGDSPGIDHEDPPPGKPRGNMIACYAIFKKLMPDGQLVIVHREVMDRDAVMKVKSFSRMKDGLLWKDFEPEAWRKTAVRRGFKSVPAVPDDLMRIVRRDDEHYELSPGGLKIGPALMPPSMSEAGPGVASAPGAVALPPASREAPMPPAIGQEPMTAQPLPMPPAMGSAPPMQEAPEPGSFEPDIEPPPEQSKEDKFLAALEGALSQATSLKVLQSIWSRNEGTIEKRLPEEARRRAYVLWDRYATPFEAKRGVA